MGCTSAKQKKNNVLDGQNKSSPPTNVQPIKPQPNVNNQVVSSQVKQSKINIDKSVLKSKTNFSIEDAGDQNVKKIFQNGHCEKINFNKITNENVSYVRQCDYFDISNEHQEELDSIQDLPDTRVATYKTTDKPFLSTPSIHKFYYDRDVIDVGYISPVDAYHQQNNINLKYPSSPTNKPTIQQHSTAQPSIYATNNNYTENKPKMASNSFFHIYDTQGNRSIENQMDRNYSNQQNQDYSGVIVQ